MGRDYASLLNADANNELYRIRFTVMVSEKLLKGINYVHLQKTDSYIIVTPLTAEWKTDGNPFSVPVYRNKDRSVCISLTKLVKHEGFVRKSLFGKRYKVKRDKKGKIYICLKEVVESDD